MLVVFRSILLYLVTFHVSYAFFKVNVARSCNKSPVFMTIDCPQPEKIKALVLHGYLANKHTAAKQFDAILENTKHFVDYGKLHDSFVPVMTPELVFVDAPHSFKMTALASSANTTKSESLNNAVNVASLNITRNTSKTKVGYSRDCESFIIDRI